MGEVQSVCFKSGMAMQGSDCPMLPAKLKEACLNDDWAACTKIGDRVAGTRMELSELEIRPGLEKDLWKMACEKGHQPACSRK
jgi:hypothetical protein